MSQLGCLSQAESVRLFGFCKAHQNLKIIMNLDAKPHGGVRVEVYDRVDKDGRVNSKSPLLVLVTDDKGQTVLPRLPYGRYYILAKGEQDFREYDYLEISRWPVGRRRKLNLELQNWGPTLEQQIVAAEQSSEFKQISDFHGVVFDQTGQRVAGARVDIVLKGTEGKKYVAHLLTNAQGEFSADLPDGDYMVIAEFPGLRRQIIAVRVSPSGAKNALLIKLYVNYS